MISRAAVGNGRYRLLAPIGQGGMARVHKAIDTRTGDAVAIKVLSEPFAADPTFIARFRHEATAASSLRHPHVVSVLDVGDGQAGPFLVMELVEGEDLGALLRRTGPLDLKLALEIGEQLCEALDAAHAKGIVHRDVKPQNVLLAPHPGGAMTAKLADFGIARAFGAPSQTRSGELLGTVCYLSPEQLRGEPATPQSDLYAVGCVLFEMLTGRVPFDAESDIAVAMRHLQDAPVAPSALRPGIPAVVDEIVLTCLRKQPAARHASVRALGEVLCRFLTFSERSTGKIVVPLRQAAEQPTPTGHLAAAFKQAQPRRPIAALIPRPLVLAGISAVLLMIAGASFFGLQLPSLWPFDGQRSPVWQRSYPERGAEGCIWYVAQWSDNSFTKAPWDCPRGVVPKRNDRPVGINRRYAETGAEGCAWRVVRWADGFFTRVPAECPPGIVASKPQR